MSADAMHVPEHCGKFVESLSFCQDVHSSCYCIQAGMTLTPLSGWHILHGGLLRV